MISAVPRVAVFCVYWAGTARDDDGWGKTVPRQTVVKLKPNATIWGA